jgi:ferredoxin
MEADLQACLTFHLIGRTPGADLPAIDALDLRPALLAGYRDLTALRYDFPVVLAQSGNDTVFVHSLSGLIDDLLRDIASGEAADRVTRHVLRLERQMRTLVAQGEGGLLSDLWNTAAGRLGVRSDDRLRDSLDRARAALRIDGEVVDCDAALASRLLTHAWTTAQRQKARRFHDRVHALIVRLSELLRADVARSNEGRSPQNLRASVGSAHQDVFDFDVMSRVLATIAPGPAPPDRSKRIGAIIATLESQRFYPAADHLDARGDAREPYTFVFESCVAALTAYRERLPAVVEMAKAIALAELEIDGTVTDSARLGLVEALDADDVGLQDSTLFPDYLVLLRGDDMDPVEQTTTVEVLEAGLPMKVLVQIDDLYDGRSAGHLGDGARGRRLATVAMGLNDVYVLQSSASQLFQSRDRIMRGIAGSAPALFSVFSGAVGASTDLPPYLVAAAAMESRAFPAFVYDPTAGPDWASRLDVRANPQANADWPVRRLTYEDSSHQRITEDVAFTLVDFLSCDRRYGRHLAGAPHDAGTGDLVPVSEWLATEPATMPTSIPAVWMADRDNVLHRVVVDAKLVRDARRCREAWHSLQELGGIHNSHAERLLARERQARQDTDAREQRDRENRTQAAGTPSELVPAAATAGTSAPAPAAVPNQEEARSSDEPYIETPRCSTCNECLQINGRLFAYNDNKQAYIADPSAGTYRQLVEAAESCQVSIIHPGKPRDPSEPGLEELLLRAGPFL